MSSREWIDSPSLCLFYSLALKHILSLYHSLQLSLFLSLSFMTPPLSIPHPPFPSHTYSQWGEIFAFKTHIQTHTTTPNMQKARLHPRTQKKYSQYSRRQRQKDLHMHASTHTHTGSASMFTRPGTGERGVILWHGQFSYTRKELR